jgi:hypothetical protein
MGDLLIKFQYTSYVLVRYNEFFYLDIEKYHMILYVHHFNIKKINKYKINYRFYIRYNLT